jgi:hypothetical protein
MIYGKATATEDYLPGAVGEQAWGYVLIPNRTESQPVGTNLPAERSRQVVFSCS